MEKPRIDLRQTETIKCDHCNSQYFREVLLLKKVSKLLTGSAEDTIVPFPVHMCDSCGHVNTGFNPFEESPENIQRNGNKDSSL